MTTNQRACGLFVMILAGLDAGLAFNRPDGWSVGLAVVGFSLIIGWAVEVLASPRGHS